MLDILNADTWFVAKLQPHGLNRAVDHLKRQGFQTFTPAIRTSTMKSGGRVESRKPLFPGYIFVKFDFLDLRWSAINATRGISRLIGNNPKRPTRVPAPIMRALMERCDASGLLLPPTDLQKGDRIRVQTGPFADTVATIESLPVQQRIGILIDLMGRAVRTTLPRDQIEKLA